MFACASRRFVSLSMLLAVATLAFCPLSLVAQETPSPGEPAAAEAPAAPAPAGPPSNADLKVMADTVWVMITGFLVFFMNLGFACVESGMCRHKNAVNILS